MYTTSLFDRVSHKKVDYDASKVVDSSSSHVDIHFSVIQYKFTSSPKFNGKCKIYSLTISMELEIPAF